MIDPVEELLVTERPLSEEDMKNSKDNLVLLGLAIGKAENQLVDFYLEIAEDAGIEKSFRCFTLGTAIKLVTDPKLFERTAAAYNLIPECPMKSMIGEEIVRNYKRLAEDYKFDFDFIYLIRAAAYLRACLSENECVLYFLNPAFNFESTDLAVILEAAAELIQNFNIDYKEPVICWVSTLLNNYLKSVLENQLARITPILSAIVQALDHSSQEKIRQSYLQACRRFDLRPDSSVLQNFKNPPISSPFPENPEKLIQIDNYQDYPYEFTGDEETMRTVVIDYMNRLLSEFKEDQRFDEQKIGFQLAEISSSDKNLMYQIIAKLWHSFIPICSSKKFWHGFIGSLKAGKVLRQHHYYDLAHEILTVFPSPRKNAPKRNN